MFIVAFAVKAQVTTPNSTLPVQNTQEVFTHNIGDLFQGGIIVSVWKDNEGVVCTCPRSCMRDNVCVRACVFARLELVVRERDAAAQRKDG